MKKSSSWKPISILPQDFYGYVIVGWFNSQTGEWVDYIARLTETGKWYTRTGEQIATPDFWQERTCPDSKSLKYAKENMREISPSLTLAEES